MDVTFVSVDALEPTERNARQHSEFQIEELQRSIREWGWTNPILANGHSVVAGNGRLEAARLMYERDEVLRLPGGEELPEGTVPVIDCAGWTEAQQRAYVLADNRLAESASWSDELLALEVEDLVAMEFDVGLAGFSDADLGRLFGSETNSRDEWRGMPEFVQEKRGFRSVVVHFVDQAAVDEFARRLGVPVSEKARYVWFPELEVDSTAGIEWRELEGSK